MTTVRDSIRWRWLARFQTGHFYYRCTFVFLLAHCSGPLFIQSKPLSHASLKRFTFEAKALRFSRNKTFIASFPRILVVVIVLLLLCLLLLIIWPNQKSNNTNVQHKLSELSGVFHCFGAFSYSNNTKWMGFEQK